MPPVEFTDKETVVVPVPIFAEARATPVPSALITAPPRFILLPDKYKSLNF